MKHLIIVDDEKMLADLLGRILKNGGQESIVFYNASDALEYIKTTDNQPSLVLIDYGLPDMDGLEFSRQLYKINPDIPVVIMTGNLVPMDTSKTHIVERLEKPIKNEVILALIQKHG